MPRLEDGMEICLDESGRCLVLLLSLSLVVQPRGTLGEKHHGEAYRDTASTFVLVAVDSFSQSFTMAEISNTRFPLWLVYRWLCCAALVQLACYAAVGHGP